MNCRSCGAPVTDELAIYCSRCGRPLGRAAAVSPGAPEEATGSEAPRHQRLDTPRPGPGPAHRSGPSDGGLGGLDLVRELAGAVRRSLRAGGWGHATAAAGLGFLAVLGVGAVFIAMLKVYDPSFGSGESSLWVVVRIVISGLASLGIPIEQVGAEGSILPLAALAFVGWALVWAVRNVVGRSQARSLTARAALGARTSVPFALMLFIASVVFRVRDGTEVGADPAGALFIGGLWGALFGLIGGALAGTSARALISTHVSGRRHRLLAEGVGAAATMLLAGAVLAAATLLIFLIVDLATGTDIDLGLSDALALAFLLVVLAPNLVAGLLAFSTGAPVRFVAQSLDVGVEEKFSLLGWDAGSPEWWWYPLLLIPLAACLLGGYVARRRTAEARRPVEIIGIAACTFGFVIALLTWLGGVSLDRVFLGAGNLIVLRADPGAAFFLSVVWAAGAGGLGWKLGEAQLREGRRRDDES